MGRRALKRLALSATAALAAGTIVAGAAVTATAQQNTAASTGTAGAVEAHQVAALIGTAQADYSHAATREGRTDYAATVDELARQGVLPAGLTTERTEAANLQITVTGSVAKGGESFTATTTAKDGTVYEVSNLSFAPTTTG